MDFKEFNDWKADGYQTKTEDEYKAWKDAFKTWYCGREWTEWEKNLIKEQIGKLNEAKTAWFTKQKAHPQIIKNNYIFREDEGKAFISLCDALVSLIEEKKKGKNF